MAFTHLHLHTKYSLLDGSCKIPELISRAKELGMDSIAITDHGVMYGVIEFYKEARAQGMKPILGCEVYVAPGSRFDKELGKNDEKYYHLVLLAENNTGYANLMKIVSKAFVEGFYYKPRVDYELLKEYHQGIIATSACLAGEVQRYLAQGFYEEAKKAAQKYLDIFGSDHYYLELQDHGIPTQQMVNASLLKMSKEMGIPLVATNDVHYVNADDAEAHDILLCIQTQKKVQDEDRMRYEGGQFYLKSEAEMRELFPYAPEAIDNTWEIAKRCNVEIEFGVTKMPAFDVPEGYSAWTYLVHLCQEGLHKRYGQDAEKHKEQLEYELNTIKNMGYVEYFLIVWDFINYAKRNGIAVGPGRGSAAGSIVSYCLEITDIDPVKYDLLFERFLNPERVSMPDIDVDFCPERRGEVIDYVIEKYGASQVAQIVTFGTLAPKNCIRDVGRALDMPYALVDQVAKMIPTKPNITIRDAFEQSSDFKNIYDTNPDVHYLIDMAKKLEGLPRHTSMHAAGVVICSKPVEELVPLSRASDGTIVTQFIMTTLEELGLLKMDFLGLRNLTVIQDACEIIEESRGIHLDMSQIDYNDKKVLDYIGTGKTEGIFQLESAGMKSFMKELKPNALEDVIAGISLYRPGPMDFIPKYLKGKNHPEEVKYDCDALVKILENTYGCIVYQEQVMQIVRDLAGYTLGRSDKVRRAMSKKKQSEMEKERKNFVFGNEAEGVAGCIANGIPKEVATKIYNEMMDFAKYAFNKSHAAAYSLVTMQTAYLKTYYPVEYMAALMTSVIDNASKVSEYIVVSRSMGIEILPPDINKGMENFHVENGKIRYGLSAIKSVGHNVIASIVQERTANGEYKSLTDFAKRLSGKEVNKRTVESFIKAGAFDGLGGNRRQMMSVYSAIIDRVSDEKKKAITGQMSLFDFVPEEEKASFEIRYPDIEEYDKQDMLAMEKEVLGVYVSGHPLQNDEEMWKKNISATTNDFIPDEQGVANVCDQSRVTVGGLISEITVKTTKTGQAMAFVILEDLVGTLEIIVFPKTFEKYRNLLRSDAKVFIYGRVDARDNEQGKLICETIVSFEDVPKTLWIQFADKETYEENIEKLYRILETSDGGDSVGIFLGKERAKKMLGRNYSVHADDRLLSELRGCFGQENVKVLSQNILDEKKKKTRW